jgi:hypothetical protein
MQNEQFLYNIQNEEFCWMTMPFIAFFRSWQVQYDEVESTKFKEHIDLIEHSHDLHVMLEC